MHDHDSRPSCLDAPGAAALTARAVDWAQTPIGPVESWPNSLRAMVGMLLRSRHPMFLWWGPELIQFYNDAYLPSFGVGKHPGAMGQRGRECWPEIWPIIGPQIEQVMVHSRATWNEDQLVPIHRNGSLEDVYWTYGYSPVFDDDGRVAGVLVVCTETTARVIAQRRLRAARALMERLSLADHAGLVAATADVLESAPEDVPFALIYLPGEGGFRLAASSKLSAAEVAIADPFLRAQLAHAARGGRDAWTVPLPTLSRIDEAPDVFIVMSRSALDQDCECVIVFGITASLPFDGSYRAHLQELADMLAGALARETLRSARERIQKQLVFADRMASVGTLAAGTAHEINNPLTYVVANLDLLGEEIRALGGGSPSGRMRDLADMAREARDGAERVRKIVRGLKTFSRMDDETRHDIELKPVLELSINMAFNEIRHRARLVKEFGPTPPVNADDSRLGQVFINLLVNAAQALPPEDADKHTIQIVTFTDPQGRAVVEVRDSGPGIPADVIDHIFEPFFTTKAIGVGTGLGLSICHNIVTGLGGEISVTSTEGHGACFRVVLPASTTAVRSTSSPVDSAAPALAPRRATVLVVDDEPAVGIILGRVLREHAVTIVTSASDALDLITSGKTYDVILSDLMMPGMSGIDLYAELARRYPSAAERMVFVTGGAFTSSAQKFLSSVANERVEKPFDSLRVRKLVEKFIR